MSGRPNSGRLDQNAGAFALDLAFIAVLWIVLGLFDSLFVEGKSMTALIHDERLADIDEQTSARRAWGLELHLGYTVTKLDDTVRRVLAAHKIIERYAVPCPQDEIGLCAGEGKHERIFECPHAGCSFLGCTSCLDRHQSAAHSLSQPDGFGEDDDQGDVSEHLLQADELVTFAGRRVCRNCADGMHCDGHQRGCLCDCGLEAIA